MCHCAKGFEKNALVFIEYSDTPVNSVVLSINSINFILEFSEDSKLLFRNYV